VQNRDGHISTCLIKTLVIYIYCAYMLVPVIRYSLFIYLCSFIRYWSLFILCIVRLFIFCSPSHSDPEDCQPRPSHYCFVAGDQTGPAWCLIPCPQKADTTPQGCALIIYTGRIITSHMEVIRSSVSEKFSV
jgi:hypothetical protein